MIMIRFVLFLLLSMLLFSCSNNKKEKLIIFHAGSLSVPIKEIIAEFEKEYPGVKVLAESAGSRKCAKKITDLKKDCDVMASADYKVINDLLIPEYADWNIRFVSNEITIVYNENSRYSDEINDKNWFDILLKDSVIFGRSDPDSDPCGYRAVLTSRLAEKYYEVDNLAKELLAKDQNYIRPKEVDLLSLLESNSIDYIFLYRSVAQQHGLKYLVLPDSINLKDPQFLEYYKSVSCEVSGKKPGEVIVKYGEPMVYGITICKNAPNMDMAMNFVEFVLNEAKGMKVMEDNGQPSVIPSQSATYDMIPDRLKKYAIPAK